MRTSTVKIAAAIEVLKQRNGLGDLNRFATEVVADLLEKKLIRVHSSGKTDDNICLTRDGWNFETGR